jgi:hypothetical protein
VRTASGAAPVTDMAANTTEQKTEKNEQGTQNVKIYFFIEISQDHN